MLCFAKVTMLISVVHVVNEVFGAAVAYFVQFRCECVHIVHCAVQRI